MFFFSVADSVNKFFLEFIVSLAWRFEHCQRPRVVSKIFVVYEATSRRNSLKSKATLMRAAVTHTMAIQFSTLDLYQNKLDLIVFQII